MDYVRILDDSMVKIIYLSRSLPHPVVPGDWVAVHSKAGDSVGDGSLFAAAPIVCGILCLVLVPRL